jgi:hypothetical protein
MATSTETRKDYGAHIPGARKRDNETTLKVLEDLATMSLSTASYPNDLVVAKLIEIRRDDIWGSLGSRLAELQDRGAGPGLALAWRVLYRTVAASAGSTEVKPTSTTVGKRWKIPPSSAYVFGHIYEAVLTRIAADMEQIPLDATWIDINQTTLLSPTGEWAYSGFFAGVNALKEIQLHKDQDTSVSVEDAVAKWLEEEHEREQMLMGLVRTKGRGLDQRLLIAKEEVLGEYAPNYKAHLRGIVDSFQPAARWHEDSVAAVTQWLSQYIEKTITGNYCADGIRRGFGFDAVEQYLDDPIAVGDSLAREAYTRIVSERGFDPFSTIKTTKVGRSTSKADDSQEFGSIVIKKVMPPTRFEHLKRETGSNAQPPRVGDISEADLCTLVPFRGIQYGNWASQAERQEMLNLAYDAMSDLALALGVSTQYLALPLGDDAKGQNLGLALGARGRGGNVAAHYEGSQHVINLTKTKGGGALAHEWMHAYDHKVATELNLGCSYASEVKGNPVYEFVQTLRKPIPEAQEQALAAAYDHKHDVMMEALLPPSVEAELAEASGGTAAWQVFGTAMSQTISGWAKDPSPVLRYACKGLRIDYGIAADNMEGGLVEHGVPEATARALATLWSNRTSGNTWIKLDRALRRDPTLDRRQSGYLAQAQLLNGNKTNGYWTNPTELLARAGSAIIFDRLRDEHGIANGFLAESSNPDQFDPKRHKANPNPAGTEREAFRAGFADTLIVNMKAEDELVQDRQEVVVGPRRQMRLF